MNVQAFSREGVVDVDNNLKNKYQLSITRGIIIYGFQIASCSFCLIPILLFMQLKLSFMFRFTGEAVWLTLGNNVGLSLDCNSMDQTNGVMLVGTATESQGRLQEAVCFCTQKSSFSCSASLRNFQSRSAPVILLMDLTSKKPALSETIYTYALQPLNLYFEEMQNKLKIWHQAVSAPEEPGHM